MTCIVGVRRQLPGIGSLPPEQVLGIQRRLPEQVLYSCAIALTHNVLKHWLWQLCLLLEETRERILPGDVLNESPVKMPNTAQEKKKKKTEHRSSLAVTHQN